MKRSCTDCVSSTINCIIVSVSVQTTTSGYENILKLFNFFYTATSAPKQSFPIADFSKANCGPNEVGGIPQSVCWDPFGKYIAVLFKDSPNVALFSTTIDRITVNISPAFFVSGNRNVNEHASFICFQPNHEKTAQVILTIGWSSGRIQYVPILC